MAGWTSWSRARRSGSLTAAFQRLAEAWARKWDGRWEYEPDDDGFKGEGVQVFSVRPAKVFAFAKGNFSHTRHVF
jgi:hypothetical protein